MMTPGWLTSHLTWLRLRGLRPATITHRQYAIRRLIASLAPVEVPRATADDLDRWQRALRLGTHAHANEVAQVRCFYRWAHTSGLLDPDPSTVLIVPRVPRGVPHPISEADLDIAMATAPHRIRPWLVLAGWAGLRAGEIARLERGDVHDDGIPPRITVSGKGGHHRVVPASPFVLDELRRAGLPSRGVVFPRYDGRRGSNTAASVSHLANRHLHRVGLDATLHSLRHRFASRIYQGTLDLRLTQEMLGHANPATTAVYAAFGSDGYQRVIDVFAAETAASPGSMLYTR